MTITRKRWEIQPRLLLITNRKSHIGFQMTWKSLILNDLEGQYCNRNCIDCSVSSRARRFYCEKYLQNLRPIFSLFIYSVAGLLSRAAEPFSAGCSKIRLASRLESARRRKFGWRRRQHFQATARLESAPLTNKR